MSATNPLPKMTPTEYLAFEKDAAERHQYVGGEVFAMSGGSPRHNVLCNNVGATLFIALRGSPCRATNSDQNVHVHATGNFVYPDVTVICGPLTLHADSSDVATNPRMVVEVLSKSTERHDRGEKWDGYRYSCSAIRCCASVAM